MGMLGVCVCVCVCVCFIILFIYFGRALIFVAARAILLLLCENFLFR